MKNRFCLKFSQHGQMKTTKSYETHDSYQVPEVTMTRGKRYSSMITIMQYSLPSSIDLNNSACIYKSLPSL